MQRQHAPDLFDYVYSVRLLGGSLNKEEVVEALVRKTIFSRNPHTLKEILSTTAFDYFRLFWDKGIVCVKQIIIDVEEAISTFVADLDELFSIYPDNGYARFVYFPAEMRVKVMKAGRDKTLLRVVYNNAERMIEPYSLKYLEKKSGEEKEYFYVFNKSGGNSVPGIRSLVSSGFQSLENTEENFIPQYQIELSKAGEIPENPYLFDPNRPVKAPRLRIVKSVFSVKTRQNRSSFSGGLKYSYQCSICGKKITKNKQDSIIGSHKSKGNNYYKCPGRFGVYLGVHY